MPAKRSRSNSADDELPMTLQPGIGVDARGGGVIDPTRNVLDLVKAESKYQDAMRDATKELTQSKFDGLQDIVDQNTVFQNAMRSAETERVDQLASLRREYESTIRNMLAESVRSTSDLVSSQLLQIQSTFNDRVTKLEAYQLTQAGKSSVADPATAEALANMAATLVSMQTLQTKTGGEQSGQKESKASVMAMIALAAAVASPLIAVVVFLVARGH